MLERLKTWLLRKITCSVNPDMVLTYNERMNLIFVNGEQISHSEALSLQAEAKFIQKTRLWSIMQETLKDHAQKTMITQSKSFEDMRSGKLMLYNLSVQKNLLDVAQKYKVR